MCSYKPPPISAAAVVQLYRYRNTYTGVLLRQRGVQPYPNSPLVRSQGTDCHSLGIPDGENSAMCRWAAIHTTTKSGSEARGSNIRGWCIATFPTTWCAPGSLGGSRELMPSHSRAAFRARPEKSPWGNWAIVSAPCYYTLAYSFFLEESQNRINITVLEERSW